MAPQTLPMAMAAIATPTFPTAAPLTSIWTPPASCATQIPTILAGGTCSSKGCTTYDPTVIATTNWNAWLSFGYYTNNYIQVSTWCAPPSTQVGDDFWYTSAKGCPSGYFTATSLSKYYTSTKTDLSIVCCPSSYTSLRTFGNGGYACARSVTAPETMSVVAWGTLFESNTAGSVTLTYGTISPISTTVVQPTMRTDGSRPMVYAAVVQMVVQSAGVTPILNPSPQSGSNSGATQPFHLGPLNFIYSIVVLVVGGVFCLGLACCCCYCACRRKSSPITYAPQPQPYTPPYNPRPYNPRPRIHEISTPEPHRWDDPKPTPVPVPVPVAVQECPHSISDSCRSSINKPCCACADKRTGKLSREARVRPYCIFCNLFWTTVPIIMCPPEWELLGPRCAHNQNGKCEGEQDSNSCCACLDKRREVLDLDLRVSIYCAPCRRAWETKQPNNWPDIWGRPAPREQGVHPVKPTTTPKPKQIPKPRPDLKDFEKTVELSILSGVQNTSDREVFKPIDGAENDGLEYGNPTFHDTSSQHSIERGVPLSPKALPNDIGLGMLSQVGRGAENETIAPAESNKNDGLSYGPPTFQVSPTQSPSQGWTRSSIASASASASAARVSVASEPFPSSQNSTPMTERRTRAKSGLLYTAPSFSVPEDLAER